MMPQSGRSLICLTLFFNFLMIIECELVTLNTSAGSSCPSSCYCDESNIYVSCVGDKTWDFSLPKIPITVTRLETRNYHVPTIFSNLLASLSQLQELKFQEMSTGSIDDGSFQNLTSLERLDLSQNLLRFISNRTFEGISKSLKYLDLSSNQLTSIKSAFVQCHQLEQLNLKDNKLINLSIDTFVGLVKLQYLNLDSNLIKHVEVGSFLNLNHLAHLLISNNPLSSLTRFDSMSLKLQYLDLSNVSLTSVPKGLDPYIRELRLAGNKIKQIYSGDFDDYIYLNILVLDNNWLVSLEKDSLGRLQYLIKLWLSGNQLNRIPSNLPPSLRELYLEMNREITQIDDLSFAGLVNLEQLHLGFNRVESIEKTHFADLNNLLILDLQRNQIQILKPNVFKHLTKLITLDLSGNLLKFLAPNCFKGLVSLSALYLSDNSAEVMVEEANIFNPLENLVVLDVHNSPVLASNIIVNQSLSNISKLQELNLMDNQLTTIRVNLSEGLKNLKLIKLNDNKWHCDENIRPLLEWIHQKPNIFYKINTIYCFSPKKYQLKTLIEVKNGEFLSSSNHSKTGSDSRQFSSQSLTINSVHQLNVSSNSSNPSSKSTLFHKPNQKANQTVLIEAKLYQATYLNQTISSSPPPANNVTLIATSREYKVDPSINSFKSSQFTSSGWSNQARLGLIKTFDSKVRPSPNELTFIITIKIVFGLLLLSTLFFILLQAIFKYKSHFGSKSLNRYKKSLKRRSSVSYLPQKDDISILTVTELDDCFREESDQLYLRICKNQMYQKLPQEQTEAILTVCPENDIDKVK